MSSRSITALLTARHWRLPVSERDALRTVERSSWHRTAQESSEAIQ